MSTFRDWLINNRKYLVFAFILFLVSAISFAAGYLLNREHNPAPIVIEKRTNQ